MYGLKSPTYRSYTQKLIPEDNARKVIKNFNVTKGNTKLYIAKSLSDEVTSGLHACMKQMSIHIIENLHF